ncbi:MAG: hypothetical protein U5R49_00960 [Deltaproteobacteria bacterium]|nr:hypothetical protein [Deltaproteobacteria bacterium]
MAESEYSSLFASMAVPFLSEPMTLEEILEELEAIIGTCSWFYPAYLEQGIRLLANGHEQQGTRKLDEGFWLMLKHCPQEQLIHSIDHFLDGLEILWRYDLSHKYAQTLIESYPDVGLIQDCLGYSAAMLNHFDQAARSTAAAVQLEPDNVHFASNHGWIHLIAGNLTEAEKALHRAKEIEPEDRIVLGNIEILEFLQEHGGTYTDYLLRFADKEELERLADEERWEEVDELVEDYNSGRIEAMGMLAVRSAGSDLSKLSDRISTLKHFFGFVHKLENGIFLYDDIAFLDTYFKTIMHKFIFKFKDVDQEMVESIYAALLQFYGFLAEHNVITSSARDDFKSNILALQSEILEKTRRYNAIRHDPSLHEPEKEALRDEILEGDHA